MNKAWLEGEHVQVDTLRKGDRFLAYSGETYTYERIDGASNQLHHAIADSGAKITIGGRAHVVPLFEGFTKRRCGIYECAKGHERIYHESA